MAAIANQFWAAHPQLYIGVHCAYGFNRTGFVLASYMVLWRGLSVDQAMAAFAAARPPGIRHEKFQQELHKRYDEMVDSRSLPPLGISSGPADGRGQYAGGTGRPDGSSPKANGASSLAQDLDGGSSGEAAVNAAAETGSSSGSSSRGGADAHATADSAHGPGAVAPRALRRDWSYASENESLGASDRLMLEGFKKQLTAAGLSEDGLEELTPAQAAAAVKAAQPHGKGGERGAVDALSHGGGGSQRSRFASLQDIAWSQATGNAAGGQPPN